MFDRNIMPARRLGGYREGDARRARAVGDIAAQDQNAVIAHDHDLFRRIMQRRSAALALAHHANLHRLAERSGY